MTSRSIAAAPSIPLPGRPSDEAPAAGSRAAVRLPEITWAGAIATLVLVIWLIPIKSYKLPVNLPFNLEIYRLLIIVFLAVWALSVFAGKGAFRAGGQGKPLALISAGAFGALLTNLSVIDAGGLQTQALKSLSFFLSYVIAFLLISSTLERITHVITVMRAIVLGAVIVAGAAIYESRTQHNLFDHLQSWLPFLVHFGRNSQARLNFNGGQLRVRASAQHPIALGAALVMCVPLAIHLAQRASSKRRSRAWFAIAGFICMGAMSTVSRTVILMLLAMTVTAFVLYGKRLLRYWPLLIVLVGVTHFAAPGVVSHIYKRFHPKGGMVSQLASRSGMRGSGRLADVGPGVRYWAQAPLFGHGLGTVAATGESITLANPTQAEGPPIIFDDQYMNTLVTLGLVGIISILWFVWGGVVMLARAARAAGGRERQLLAACAISCAGFGAGMATFDSFTFVQATLLFFIVAALGLRVRSICRT